MWCVLIRPNASSSWHPGRRRQYLLQIYSTLDNWDTSNPESTTRNRGLWITSPRGRSSYRSVTKHEVLHAYELWQPRVLPSRVIIPSQRFRGGAWCIAIARALIKHNINPQLLEHNEEGAK